MNNVIMRKVTVTSAYAPLVAESVVGTFTISCPPSNSGPVNFLGDDGSDVPWIPSEWNIFKHIDLHTIQVKGTVGDKITVVGGTW
jgi:hypothetical protein